MPEPFYSAQKGRHGLRLPVGNEGAGTVIAAGEGEAAQALIGQRVACLPRSAYSQYCILDTNNCLPLGDVSSEDGASAFVNPLTALGFAETARMEGHSAIIHTAAASNLGQMLVKICKEDDIALVNIVRKAEQVKLFQTWVQNISSILQMRTLPTSYVEPLKIPAPILASTLSVAVKRWTIASGQWNK